MSADLPILWEDKENSPELEAALAQFGIKYYFTAEEINQLKRAVNEMSVIQQSTFKGTAEPGSTPTGTGNRYWTAITPATYANHGNVVVAANSLAIISVTAAGVWSISQTSFDISSKVNVSDVINNLISTETIKPLSAAQGKALNEKIAQGITAWTAKSYLSGDQVNYLGKDWFSNAATVAGDVPGISSKWVERLSYLSGTYLLDNLCIDPFFINSAIGSTSVPNGYNIAANNGVTSLIKKSSSLYGGNSLELTINAVADDYQLEFITDVEPGFISLGLLLKQNIAKNLIKNANISQFDSSGVIISNTSLTQSSFIDVNKWGFVSLGNLTLDNSTKSVKIRIRVGGTFLTSGDVGIIEISALTASQSDLTLVAPKRNFKNEILIETIKTDAKITEINNRIDNLDAKKFSNDWYDPYLSKPYSAGYFATPMSYLNWYGAYGSSNLTPSSDSLGIYPYCQKWNSYDTSVIGVGLTFSKDYLNLIGYNNGETFKCGFLIRFPQATTINKRAVYIRKNLSSTWQVININNSDWNWINPSDEVTVDNSVLQGYDFAIRYCEANEDAYITGLTLQNTTKTVWQNKLLKNKLYEDSKVTVQNQYIWEEYIDENTPLYKNTYDQNNAIITKSIVDLRIDITAPVKSDALKITSEPTKVNRPNLSLYNNGLSNTASLGDLFPLNRNVKVQIGFWVKCEADIDNLFSVRFLTTSEIIGKQYHMYSNLKTNKWYWVESLPLTFSQFDFKAINSTSAPAQLLYNYTDSSSFYIAGVTIGYVNNIPLNFGYSRYYKLNDIGRWYRMKWCSYGDSITDANNYQPIVMSELAMKHYLRGIGGSMVVNNNTIAWVDINGLYLSRPPSSPPAGNDGVDYFTINASMCTQSRVNTIPLDTDFLTIMAGANDSANGNVIGTVNDIPSDLGSATFYASMKSMIDKIILRVPKAVIVILGITYRSQESTNSFGGNYFKDYRNAQKNIAEMYGLPYIDMIDLGVNDKNWTSYSSDIVHPNYYFAKLIGKRIVKGLIDKTSAIDEIKL